MRQLFRRPGPEARLAAAARQEADETQDWRLLVVEDDPLFSSLVMEIAAAWEDVDVRCVEDLAGLEAATSWEPDVVLLDLELPDSAGLDTLARTLRLIESASIVVFTGSDQDGLGLEAVRHGAQDFMPKLDLDERLLRRTLRFALERRRLEQVKRDMVRERSENERLRALQTERSRFYQGVTEHLRGPLEGIGVQMSLLGHEVQDRRHRHSIGSLQEQVDQLAHLNAALHDLAAIEAGSLEVARTSTDLSELMAKRLPVWQDQARHARLAMDAMLAPDVVVDVEAARMEEVLDRVIDNAIRHTPAGGVITVCLEHDGEARISIADNGCGIIPERLDRVFDAYLWEPEARTGMGMGLAICRGILAAVDGSITLSSQNGTSVEITLPSRIPTT